MSYVEQDCPPVPVDAEGSSDSKPSEASSAGTGSVSVPAKSQPMTGPELILRSLQLIVAQDWPKGCILELRALGQHTYNGYFDTEHLPQMADTAWRLSTSKHVDGVYCTLNPVKPELLARRMNRADRCGRSDGSTDNDIIARGWLLIDCDPNRPSGISSTNDELEKARVVARQVYEFLKGRGWPEPIPSVSGNGFHLLYRIYLPANDGGLVQQVLKALAEKFSTADVNVDTKVGNASRICKLYGTWARKGDSTPDRPHRQARIIAKSIGQVEVVSRELLGQVAAMAPIQESRSRRTSPALPTSNQSIEDRAAKYIRNIEPSIQGQDGSRSLRRVAVALVRGFSLAIPVAVEVSGEWNQACVPPWSEGELLHAMERAHETADEEFGYLLSRPRTKDDSRLSRAAIRSAEFSPFETNSTCPNDGIDWTDEFSSHGQTDIANAKRLANKCSGEVFWILEWSRFIAWDGSRFTSDGGLMLESLCKDVARDLWETGLAEDDHKRADVVLKFAAHSSSRAIAR